jgi:hypothetical protein
VRGHGVTERVGGPGNSIKSSGTQHWAPFPSVFCRALGRAGAQEVGELGGCCATVAENADARPSIAAEDARADVTGVRRRAAV